MLKKLNQKKAQSAMEYIAFSFILMLTMLVFQKYLVRAIIGRYKVSGDGIAQGRIYDPNQTTKECAFDLQYHQNWYDATCYRQQCVRPCLTVYKALGGCPACIQSCKVLECDGL